MGLHRLDDGAAAAVLFLVPPASRVQMSLKLGPLQTNLVSDKEDLVGLAGCYSDQLATCRKELQAQLAREEADARVEARRQARRRKRLGKGKKGAAAFAPGFLGRRSAKRGEGQRASAVAPGSSAAKPAAGAPARVRALPSAVLSSSDVNSFLRNRLTAEEKVAALRLAAPCEKRKGTNESS